MEQPEATNSLLICVKVVLRLESELEDGEDENHFHDVGPINHAL